MDNLTLGQLLLSVQEALRNGADADTPVMAVVDSDDARRFSLTEFDFDDEKSTVTLFVEFHGFV